MERVQIALADEKYSKALAAMLGRSGAWDTVAVDVPDPSLGGVMVVDSESLERLPHPLACLDRIVLVTRNNPEQLSRAWEVGIHSVVFDNDPLNTAELAIMAASLRVPRPKAAENRTRPAGVAAPATRDRPGE